MARKTVPVLLATLCLLPGCSNFFHPKSSTCTLTVAVVPSAEAGFVVPATGSQYPKGIEVDLAASPHIGYIFDHWEGDASGTSASTTVVMSEDRSVTAVFAAAVGSITGTVVDSAGGSAVVGVLVEVAGGTAGATTDASGVFTLASAPVGGCDLLVSGGGRAGSRLQSVEVTEGGLTRVEIVQPAYAIDAGRDTPPTLTVGGVSAGGAYGSTTSITVQAAAGSFPVEGTDTHSALLLRIGTANGPYVQAASESGSLEYAWNPADLPAGPVLVQAVAYDLNNNRGEVSFTVTALGGAGLPPGSAPAPDEYYLEGQTFGRSLDLLFSRSPAPRPPAGRISRPRFSGPSIRSAPPDATAIVLIEASARGGTTGLNIYAADATGGPYIRVGQVTSKLYDDYLYYPDDYYYPFYDTSSRIVPGSSRYYRLAYFNAAGEGPPTGVLTVPILPACTLTLTSPIDGAVITDLTPTLAWSATLIPSATRWHTVEVWKTSTGVLAYSWEDPTGNALSITCDNPLDPLERGVLYEWNVYSWYLAGSGSIWSSSYPTAGDASTNGSFYFTIR